MKVHIGPYVKWFGPYQIAEKLLFWKNRESEEVQQLGKRLAENKNGDPTWLAQVCTLIYEKRKRKVKVHIDNYDVWNLDSTLAIIIVPLLRKLHQSKQGSGLVDIGDVPDGLKYGSIHEKYDWLLLELIWTFEQLSPDSDWQQRSDILSDAYKADAARIDNGLRLFGKYYQTLWD